MAEALSQSMPQPSPDLPAMNLHQFRFIQAAVRHQLNLTETARALFTSQPGISKAILEFEAELGIEIFERHGKRLRKMTAPGLEVLKSVEVIMREIGNLKRIGEEFSEQDSGTLSIATTHAQARYFLPGPVAQLRREFPKVRISLHQGAPAQVAQMVRDDIADIGLATEGMRASPELVTLPCYEWQHAVVMPHDHPLARVETLTLADLAAYPLVSYHPSFSGRSRVDAAFASHKLQPNIVLEAIDADVIKTYVRLGLGIGILAEIAVREDSHHSSPFHDLLARPVGHLFGNNTTRVAFKRGAYLRGFVYSFAQSLSEQLTRHQIEQAMGTPAASA
jgi:LysR family transcriptional regulator, cys regulon transcriptional activator